MDKKTERVGQIIAYIIGVPLCLYYFGLQFIVVALFVGGMMAWEPLTSWWRQRALSSASDDRDK